jgi:hypothetical protein
MTSFHDFFHDLELVFHIGRGRLAKKTKNLESAINFTSVVN